MSGGQGGSRIGPVAWFALTVASAAFFLLFAFTYGPMLTADGARDAAYARYMSAVGYDPFAYLAGAEEATGHNHPISLAGYLIFIALLAFLQQALGSLWLSALVVLNAFAQTVAVVLTAWLLRLAGVGGIGIAVAVALSFACFEGYQWVAMSQSDALFVPIVAGTWALSWIATSGDSPRWRFALLMGCCALIAVGAFVRPTWPPLAAAAAATAWLSLRAQASPGRIVGDWTRLMALAAVLAFGATLLSAAIMWNPTLLPGDLLSGAVARWRPFLEQGVVVISRPETYLQDTDSYWGFVRTCLVRLPYFFEIRADGFSGSHQLINWVGHVPLYILALAGLVLALRLRVELPPALRVAALSAATYVFCVASFHAMTILDFDWRYRAPMYPLLIFLAGLGADQILHAARLRLTQPEGRQEAGTGRPIKRSRSSNEAA